MKPLRVLIFFSFFSSSISGQVKVSGRVYDITQKNSLEAVSVLSTSGGGTATDSYGRYTIIVDETDSIWFSYLGKPTPKFAVSSIASPHQFEVALHTNFTVLKEFVFRPKNYKLDSLQNRIDYANVFNFKKPDLESISSISPYGGVGFDINEIIRSFQFRKNRRMEAFQERLLREEMEKFVDHRFNRALIIKLTGLRSPELDSFIKWNRPSVDFVASASEYEFLSYIKRSYLKYAWYKGKLGVIRKPDEE